MPIALIYGYLIWGDIPDMLTWFGIILILGSGIYTIHRERKVALMRRDNENGEVKDHLIAARAEFE